MYLNTLLAYIYNYYTTFIYITIVYIYIYTFYIYIYNICNYIGLRYGTKSPKRKKIDGPLFRSCDWCVIYEPHAISKESHGTQFMMS